MNDRYAAVPVKQLERWKAHFTELWEMDGDVYEALDSHTELNELDAAIESAVEPKFYSEWQTTGLIPCPTKGGVNDEVVEIMDNNDTQRMSES